MKRLLASSLVALFLSPAYVLAQCQAGASRLNSLGVCRGGDGTEVGTFDNTTTTLYDTGNLKSTTPVWNDYYQRYMPKTIAFRSTGPGAPTIINLLMQPWGTSGHYGMYLYLNGAYLMTLSQDDPTSASRWNGWLSAQGQQNVSSWYSWAVDLYWAAKAGWASSACNTSTLTALAEWSGAISLLLSGQVAAALLAEGGAIAALNAEYDACQR